MTRPPNVVLLTVDTLRADHLGCYGYHRDTSPYIDAFAQEGVLCEGMYCSALPTQPSYTTLYTGQHAVRHGIVGHRSEAEISPAAILLPELFLRAGYRTCAVDTLWMQKDWFGRGYEQYIDPGAKRILSMTVPAEDLTARAVPWIREHADEPFFLFMHYWDTHAPYTPPKAYQKLFYQGNPFDPNNHSLDNAWHHPISSLLRDVLLRRSEGIVTDAEFVVALYDQEVRHADDGLGEVIGCIDELGLAENTLILVMGDHGESLGEHGIFFEHHGLYDCTLRIPFILRQTGTLPEGTRVPQMFATHDIAPTLLEAAGLPIPSSMDGQSFWKTLTGEEQSEGGDKVYSVEGTIQAKWSLRTLDHKFILSREPDFYGTPLRELYDLKSDPGENHNIASERADLAAEMEADLEGWIAARVKEAGRSVDPLIEQGISFRDVLALKD
jgi:arylsulfatase A-like enzyme